MTEFSCVIDNWLKGEREKKREVKEMVINL